eukprot:1974691-Pyramimonas_sp.AAC.1
MQQPHGLRAVHSRNAALALTPRPFVLEKNRSLTESHGGRTKTAFGSDSNCQGATITLIRGQEWFLARFRIVSPQQSS